LGQKLPQGRSKQELEEGKTNKQTGAYRVVFQVEREAFMLVGQMVENLPLFQPLLQPFLTQLQAKLAQEEPHCYARAAPPCVWLRFVAPFGPLSRARQTGCGE